jgi:hypothetical protein
MPALDTGSRIQVVAGRPYVLAVNTLSPYILTRLTQRGLSVAASEVGQQAECELFDTEAEAAFTREFIKSKSAHILHRPNVERPGRPSDFRRGTLLEGCELTGLEPVLFRISPEF